MKRWFVARGKVKHGPFALRDLRILASKGELSPHDMILAEGTRTWTTAGTISGLFPALSALELGKILNRWREPHRPPHYRGAHRSVGRAVHRWQHRAARRPWRQHECRRGVGLYLASSSADGSGPVLALCAVCPQGVTGKVSKDERKEGCFDTMNRGAFSFSGRSDPS